MRRGLAVGARLGPAAGVIGYADAPAKLFVAGTPAWLYVLPVLAGLAALAAAAVFLYLKYRERRGGR